MSHRTWTQAEEDYIRENYKRMTDVVISIELSRITKTIVTPQSITEKRRRLGLTRDKVGRPAKPGPKSHGKTGRPRGRPPKQK
jgi:hypothetical protein